MISTIKHTVFKSKLHALSSYYSLKDIIFEFAKRVITGVQNYLIPCIEYKLIKQSFLSIIAKANFRNKKELLWRVSRNRPPPLLSPVFSCTK